VQKPVDTFDRFAHPIAVNADPVIDLVQAGEQFSFARVVTKPVDGLPHQPEVRLQATPRFFDNARLVVIEFV